MTSAELRKKVEALSITMVAEILGVDYLRECLVSCVECGSISEDELEIGNQIKRGDE